MAAAEWRRMLNPKPPAPGSAYLIHGVKRAPNSTNPASTTSEYGSRTMITESPNAVWTDPPSVPHYAPRQGLLSFQSATTIGFFPVPQPSTDSRLSSLPVSSLPICPLISAHGGKWVESRFWRTTARHNIVLWHFSDAFPCHTAAGCYHCYHSFCLTRGPLLDQILRRPKWTGL